MPGFEEDRLRARAWKVRIDFLRGKAQDRRDPANERLYQVIHRRLRRTPSARDARHRVHAILDHIEIERAQLDDAKLMYLLIDQVKIVRLVCLDDFSLQLRGLL